MRPLMRYFNRTARCASIYRSRMFEPLGLESHHHPYIINICQNEGITGDELSKIIFVNKSTIARQLLLLEEKGFIVRKQSTNDRRSQLIYPTSKAKDIYPVVLDILDTWNNSILDGLDSKEIESLISMLQRITDNATKLVMEDE